MTRALLIFALASTVAGCTLEQPRVLAEQCDLNTGCNVPLVCGLGRCHHACASKRDCDLGASCVRLQDNYGVCLLPDETNCISDSDCPETLVCRNESCVNTCEENRDCPAGQACATLEGRNSCVEANDSCARNSDCVAPLVCLASLCRVQCLEDVDCALAERCDEGVCSQEASSPDAGTDDAGTDDAARPDATVMDAGPPDAEPADTGPAADAGDAALDGGGPPPFECGDVSECTSSTAGDGSSYRCEGSRCVVVGCGAGRGDCDFDTQNGCEQTLDVAAHCGGCGIACHGPGATCTAGACSTIAQVAGGDETQCYRWDTGAVYCWGDNRDGEVGDGTTEDRDEPTLVAGLDAVDIDAGGRHTCAVERGGRILCWGANGKGQLGDGVFMDRLTPSPVTGLPDPATDPAVDVSAGDEHTCAVLASGALYCWGRQSDSRLGNSVNSSAGLATPLQVNGVHLFDQVAAGHESTCAVRRDGLVMCWGNRDFGQVGDGGTTSLRGGPSATVRELVGAVSVENGSRSGSQHSCALRADGGLSCWGVARGIGYGGIVNRAYAVSPSGVTSVSAYGVGSNMSCAADAIGDLYCWGTTPEFTGLRGVTLVAMTEEVIALSEGRLFTFRTVGSTPRLVDGF